MRKPPRATSRRGFLRELWRQGPRAAAAFQAGREEARRQSDQEDFFSSYQSSYAMTLCEEELVLESARMAGIETQGRETTDIAAELFRLQEGT